MKNLRVRVASHGNNNNNNTTIIIIIIIIKATIITTTIARWRMKTQTDLSKLTEPINFVVCFIIIFVIVVVLLLLLLLLFLLFYTLLLLIIIIIIDIISYREGFVCPHHFREMNLFVMITTTITTNIKAITTIITTKRKVLVKESIPTT